MSADHDQYEMVKANARIVPWYECSEDELADWVDLWHTIEELRHHEGKDLPLHTFLGMTHEQYKAWVENPEEAKRMAVNKLRGDGRGEGGNGQG